jgi:hypothetical protein
MGEKRTHLPKPKSKGMSDWVECSCGWISTPFWDGMEWALDQWKKHQAEVGVR